MQIINEYSQHKSVFRVYWEDTDAGGIVYHARYLQFFERGRTEWLRKIGVEQSTLKQQTSGQFVVVQQHIAYHASARLDDQLCIDTQLSTLGKVSCEFTQTAYRLNSDKITSKVAHCVSKIGFINAETNKPMRIPAELVAAMQIDTST